MNKQRGFTLLEVIVAMVLVAGAGVALFSWVSQSLDGIHRSAALNERARAQIAAVEYMQSVNPMLRPTGEANLGNFGLSWKAIPVEDARDNADHPRGIGYYQVQLFTTSVELVGNGGVKLTEFKMQQVGYKRVREARLL